MFIFSNYFGMFYLLNQVFPIRHIYLGESSFAKNCTLVHTGAAGRSATSGFHGVLPTKTAFLVRREREAPLTLTDELSVKNVCAVLGFDDRHYFFCLFTKVTGETPTHCRYRVTHLKNTGDKQKNEQFSLTLAEKKKIGTSKTCSVVEEPNGLVAHALQVLTRKRLIGNKATAGALAKEELQPAK